jgi:sterol desaturase/sphingolipid hydroxylase (fatty acid hydroxylase superfamily)
MNLITIEHSKLAYRADFTLYGAAIAALAGFLLLAAPPSQGAVIAACVTAGVALWTLVEYGLHRFVLHGVAPFRRWHAEHHARPTALICAPTILTASLIAGLVFLPALLLADLWLACALTLGLLAGYQVYAVTHHATHHWRARSAWFRRRKQWHALHHHHEGGRGSYGVTTGFWDHVFGSAGRAPRVRGTAGGGST